MPATRNRLAAETSPYLLQHAHNPVEWYPWGPEALERAREEDKPILLSIGYSACHWCHVMAHESFEDAATAALMNQLYINIKVDREERPDLDKIYQLAHQILAQRPGGWPLTVFLTPDQVPYFAGTYFPREPRYNMPTFTDVLRQIAAAYRQQGSAIGEQNAALLEAMQQTVPVPGDGVRLEPSPLDHARRELAQQYDPHYGGFGQAPKFPHPTSLERLLRHWDYTRAQGHADDEALAMARLSLHAMASGGVFDQLGGGFCRYSTDAQWMIPHFEKMLYDNGQLLGLYAEAWLATGDAAFRRVAEETARWVLCEMQSPEGGYYAAQDADTEGEEGHYYVWTQAELHALLDADEYRVLALHYGFDRAANIEGHWYPHVFTPLEAVAESLDLRDDRVRALLESGRHKLLTARGLRTRPGTDTKVISAWNGLMVKGLAQAGRALARPDLIASAQRAVDFVRAELWQGGRLLATYKDGRARHPGCLDDYAFLLDGLLHLLQADWRDGDLAFALDLAEALLAQFEDPDRGGFYYTGHHHEPLIHRPKPSSDEAIPAGNGVAALALQRLAHLVGEGRYARAATRTLEACWSPLSQLPYGHATLLTALEEHLYPPQTIVLRGLDPDLGRWQAEAAARYAPRRSVYAIPATATGLPAALAARHSDAPTCAWVCEGVSCRPPISDPALWRATLARPLA